MQISYPRHAKNRTYFDLRSTQYIVWLIYMHTKDVCGEPRLRMRPRFISLSWFIIVYAYILYNIIFKVNVCVCGEFAKDV